jgi:hypothetical protein
MPDVSPMFKFYQLRRVASVFPVHTRLQVPGLIVARKSEVARDTQPDSIKSSPVFDVAGAPRLD